ncbi:MAG TPA: hypothetical protein PKC99_18875 [Anaerolineales bacterium]|nr:hypothetical protein [Chloroflexota bacterium]WKZ50300.1 MAG: hypothetical protein QY329_12640 [Anaerolineales bacterium]NOG76781.1 hypothetical protein [Chloroflexota bacterium]WKZ55132.1 MAG: hypothetical protein QY324_03715 [Anaerolineales bacterium]GIK11172.1 MAG: hypothetical protein BroJett001_32380 [Chloroflexota bacterium]
MNLNALVFIGLVMWGLGFFRSKVATKTETILLLLPFWFTVLCGRPNSKELPSGVLHAVGVWFQLIGWLMFIYGIFASLLANNPISTLIGVFISLIVGRVILALVIKKYKYEVQA